MTQPHGDKVVTSVAFAIVTVSDTRTPATDASGDTLAALLVDAGHTVAAREIVPDEAARVEATLRRVSARPDIDAIVFTGGTGVAPRDITVETVDAHLAKRLPGFGELFRAASAEEIGSRAMLTRATAGAAAGKAVFVIPGSTPAVRLAAQRFIIPEIGHFVWLLRS
jgi:molybdenum cofactor biosynthesis protein B